MIRIKCPKCTAPQSLDDDEAGGVGVCDSCGAKFRVPAAKPKARVPVPRDEDDDDEDEEDEDEGEDDRPARKRRAPRKRPVSSVTGDEEEYSAEKEMIEREKAKRLQEIAAEQFAMNVRMAISLFFATVFLGVAGIFLNRVAIYTIVIGAVLQILTMIMVSALAKQESTMWFLLTRAVPGMVMVFAIMHWDQTKRYVIANIAGGALVGVGVLAFIIHTGKKEARRAIIAERVKTVQVIMHQPYRLV